MAKDGTLILMKIGGVVLSGLTSNSLAVSVDTAEATTKDSNMHKEYIGTEDDGTMDFEKLYDPTYTYDLSELWAAMMAKTPVAVIHGGIVAGDEIVSANAIITSLNWDAPKAGVSTVSGSLQLTGAKTFGTVADAVSPLLVKAWINNATPTILRLEFDEDLDPAYVVAGTAWSADGSVTGAKTVSATAISGAKVNLTMNEAYGATDVVTVTYTKPGGAQDIRDKSGNEVATITAEAVTNNVTA